MYRMHISDLKGSYPKKETDPEDVKRAREYLHDKWPEADRSLRTIFSTGETHAERESEE